MFDKFVIIITTIKIILNFIQKVSNLTKFLYQINISKNLNENFIFYIDNTKFIVHAFSCLV